jgi:hypothetical protein
MMLHINKLECLSLANFGSHALCMSVRLGALPDHFRGGLVRDEHSSIFGLFVSDKEEKVLLQWQLMSRYCKTFSSSMMLHLNKLECLSLANLGSNALCLWVRPGAFPDDFRYSTEVVWSGTNTPAYLAYSSVTKKKKFYYNDNLCHDIIKLSLLHWCGT